MSSPPKFGLGTPPKTGKAIALIALIEKETKIKVNYEESHTESFKADTAALKRVS